MTVKTFDGLPEESFSTLHTTGETIKIKRGEKGYYRLPDAYMTADQLNEIFEVTPAQAQAMSIGSMAGWDVPGANPAYWNEDGTIKKD